LRESVALDGADLTALESLPARAGTGPNLIITTIAGWERAVKKKSHKASQDKRAAAKQNWKELQIVHPDAAGIDIGGSEHWVAISAERDPEPVRCYGVFTADLNSLAEWLREKGVRSVAMQSTGVYWIAVLEILQQQGLEVFLVNARHTKNLAGRKSDIAECQWLLKLHTLGC
jgi:transposase